MGDGDGDGKKTVFIGWSGARSKAVASALHGWLRKMVQAADPWMSEHDIDGGMRWSPEIAKTLESSNFGILCLTPENLNSTYIHFEAGAIAKVVDQSRLMPYLLDLKDTQVKPPLADFQMGEANAEGTLKLVQALNAHVNPRPLEDSELRDMFTAMWPTLEKKIATARGMSGATIAPRGLEDMVKEVLERIRELERRAGPSPEAEKYVKEALARRLDAKPTTLGLNLPGYTLGTLENSFFSANDAIREMLEQQARTREDISTMVQGLGLNPRARLAIASEGKKADPPKTKPS